MVEGAVFAWATVAWFVGSVEALVRAEALDIVLEAWVSVRRHLVEAELGPMAWRSAARLWGSALVDW